MNAEPVAKAFFVIDDSHYRDFGIRNLRTLSLPIALYRLQATFFDGMPDGKTLAAATNGYVIQLLTGAGDD